LDTRFWIQDKTFLVLYDKFIIIEQRIFELTNIKLIEGSSKKVNILL
jgi:hypothetical protein